MVRPFEKPHGRLPRRPSVPSPSRNRRERNSSWPRILSLVEGRALRGAISESRTPTLHHSITPSLHSSVYLSIYIEQHGKIYLPFSCFHLGSLASCAALCGLKRDGWKNASSLL